MAHNQPAIIPSILGLPAATPLLIASHLTCLDLCRIFDARIRTKVIFP